MAKFVVGITGGIGSGKTTVAKLFETLGASLIDTDEIAHQLTQPGAPAVDRIRALFGEQYVDADGALHRSEMRALVFQDPEAKRTLEGILHPLIAAEALRRVTEAEHSYCILVIPLYTESARWRWIGMGATARRLPVRTNRPRASHSGWPRRTSPPAFPDGYPRSS